MVRTKLFIYFLLFIAISCNKSKTEAEFLYSKYVNFDSIKTNSNAKYDTLEFQKGYKVKIEYDTLENLHRIEGVVLGSMYGHYFKFNIWPKLNKDFPLGKLETYNYQKGAGCECFTYGIKYNFNTKTYSEEGSPAVDYFVFNNEKDTSIRYTFHFSTFPRDILKASYSLDGKNYNDLKLIKSEYMPFLEEAVLYLNMNLEKIIIKTTSKGLIYYFPNLPNERSFIDTMLLTGKAS